MKTKALAVAALLVAAPALAATQTEIGARWVWWMDWIEVCTTDKPWHLSDAERLKVCLRLEQELRDYGRCMYSPGVMGIWTGKHCR